MIGYYVHHHGAGHAARHARIAAASSEPVIALSELDLGGVLLPSDAPRDSLNDPTAGGALHWAPLDVDSAAPRAKAITTWIEAMRPAGVVIDVSCEAALLCRLAGVATVVVRQHGTRTDSPHELAYRSAAVLLAPWPEQLEAPDTPTWIVDKTVYSGFIHSATVTDGGQARIDRSEDLVRGPDDLPRPDDVVVLWGAGGGRLPRGTLATLADAVRPSRVHLLGDFGHLADPPPNVVMCGFVSHVNRYLRHRPTVVASAGNNVVAEVAGARCALIVIPQHRPFDEQHAHARALERQRFAAVVDPSADRLDWRTAIQLASARAPRLAAVARPDGASRAARAIATAFGRRRM